MRAFVVALWCVLVSLPASAAGVLVLPVDGAGVLGPIRDALEQSVRASLLAAGRTAVLSVDDTRAILDDAAGAGLACSLADPQCAVKIGVVAGVDEVWLPRARLDQGRTTLVLTRLDVPRGTAVHLVAGEVQHGDGGTSVDVLVARALHPEAVVGITGLPGTGVVTFDGLTLGRAPLPPVATTTGRHTVAVDGVTQVVDVQAGPTTVAWGAAAVAPVAVNVPVAVPVTPPTAATTGGSPLWWPGVVAIGVGAAAGVIGGLGAVVTDQSLGAPPAGGNRAVAETRALQTQGLAFVVTGVVGGLAALTGTGLVVASLSPAPEAP